MEICRKDSGEPFVVLHGKGLTLLRERGGRIVHLSLSHTAQHATATAVLESA
jgi:phosphopantetheinyl transferase (holo-ACP synthase)